MCTSAAERKRCTRRLRDVGCQREDKGTSPEPTSRPDRGRERRLHTIRASSTEPNRPPRSALNRTGHVGGHQLISRARRKCGVLEGPVGVGRWAASVQSDCSVRALCCRPRTWLHLVSHPAMRAHHRYSQQQTANRGVLTSSPTEVGRNVPSIYVRPDAERPVRLAFAQLGERVARAVRARF